MRLEGSGRGPFVIDLSRRRRIRLPVDRPVEDRQPIDDQPLGRPLGPVPRRIGGVDEGADDDRLQPLARARAMTFSLEAFRPADTVDADDPVLAVEAHAAFSSNRNTALAKSGLIWDRPPGGR